MTFDFVSERISWLSLAVPPGVVSRIIVPCAAALRYGNGHQFHDSLPDFSGLAKKLLPENVVSPVAHFLACAKITVGIEKNWMNIE